MDRRNFMTAVPTGIFASWATMAGLQVEEEAVAESLAAVEALPITNKDRWEQTGILQGTPEHLKETLATMLENQRIQNEQFTDTIEVCTWKRISIPVLVRAFRALNHDKYKVISICDIKDETKPEVLCFGKGFWNKDIHQKFRSLKYRSLDEEANQCAEIAKQLSDKLNNLMEENSDKILCLYCVERFDSIHISPYYYAQDPLFVYYRLIKE